MTTPTVERTADPQQVPGGVLARRAPAVPFEVHLDVFDGPFDLLLGLISKHRLDITQIALAQVTDEFIAHIRARQGGWDLSQASEFLLIGATLLDLKAARLLPQGAVEDDEDLALIEARDLLFARLLQYRAYKQVAALFAELEAAALRRYPADVGLEDKFTDLLPEVRIGATPAQFADIAAGAMRPRTAPTINVDHLHSPKVSVPEQAQRIMEILARLDAGATASFADLVAECTAPIEIVARFLALLELYRQKSVGFEQGAALEELRVGRTGEGDAQKISDEEYG